MDNYFGSFPPEVLCNDQEGALNTQENFSRQCPIVSQSRSLVEAIFVSEEAAVQTQLEQFGMLNGLLNGFPLVGHVKGTIHFYW